MVFEGETVSMDYGLPKQVELPAIEVELERLVGEAIADSEVHRVFGRALTLVVYCEDSEESEEVDRLIGRIITRSSARAIMIRAEPHAPQPELHAYIRAHCVIREDNTEQCAEQIAFHVRDDALQELPAAVLRLRLRDLPLVVWWRSQPEPDNPLFVEMLQVADQIILDSAVFTAPIKNLGQLVSELRRESERLPFGDLNWARLTPWRELVAQFFDVPEHLTYLTQLNEIVLEYSAGEGGNPAQALLLTMWLATMLDWQVVSGSWERKGKDRALRLRNQEGHEIRVEIHGREDTEVPRGWLSAVSLRVRGEPPASFHINWCGENCVTTQVQIGDRLVENSRALNIPDEATLVVSEFDASQRDRVYHHVLQVLEQLLT